MANIVLGDIVSSTEILLDEDDMASDSDTQGATQQSIKAYADAGGSGPLPGARGLLSADQSIPSGSWSLLDLDVIDWDVGGGFNVATHGYDVHEDGQYMICVATKVINITDGTPFGCSIFVNGALAGGRVTFFVGGTDNPGAAASDMLDLLIGDFVQVAAFQKCGANRLVEGGNIFTNYLAIRKLL